ncbi:hypothetical protein HANVADRAFT_5233 [Hanseniaspora valbyensis NRRL Y-1626]|uniref:AVL9/DENND6 domain-containing protein n=1 Tax=Hanseniaspora valbyensis NRRL Y-1626 TaxID=766949 RepID=A0A1B7TI84_9ASCO|nr:hypothetical protein HANVADRAFT_5233 [Hanseniaspora valbyensis NRRL Y-1626]
MSDIYDILLCSFDITNGNVIEYSINNHFSSDDSNISFKAMPDNCHTLDSLYNIIHIDDTHYGISYFKKLAVDDIKQRNSVYKALIIVTNQLNLTLLLKNKLKLTMDLILNDSAEDKFDVTELLNSLYSNLNMIYKDDLYLDYIDNQIMEYDLERFMNVCKDVDILSIFKLFLLEKRVVFYTEDISLLEDVVFLQIALLSLYPNLLNQFSFNKDDTVEASDNKDENTTFNVLDIMSKYKFLKLPLKIFKEKSSWAPYVTIDEVENFIHPKNQNESFVIGLGNSLFLNHKQVAAEAKKRQSLEQKEEAERIKNEQLKEKQEQEGENIEKQPIRQKKRVNLDKIEREIELVHYDVGYKLVSNGENKLPKLELDYWSTKLNKDSIKSSSQDIRFMNILFKEMVKMDSTTSKDKFIRKQFESYLIDLLFFIKFYYYKEFVKLTSLDYDELKEKKIKRGETQIEKNTRKLQLKALEMILSESEHNKIDLNIKKQFDAFGGKPFFKKWFKTGNYKKFMTSTDDRLFDIEMNEDLEFVMNRDNGNNSEVNDKKWEILLNERFWSVEHPVYNLEIILDKRQEETGTQWRLNLPEMKLPELKLPDMKMLNFTDVNLMLPEVKLKDMMYWGGGLFQQQQKNVSEKKKNDNNQKEVKTIENSVEKEQDEKEVEQKSEIDTEAKSIEIKSVEAEGSAPMPDFKNTLFNSWAKLTKKE